MRELVAAVVLVGWGASTLAVQDDPLRRPLLDLSRVQPRGSFSVGLSDGAGGLMDYGGSAIGVSEDGRFLYWSCQLDATGIAKLEIPPLDETARVEAPCRGPKGDDIAKIHPDPKAWRPVIGGVLELGGRITVAGFIIYDASGETFASHWSGPSLTQLSGPFSGTVSPGLVKSQMAPVPPEWRELLGGPAMASAGYSSIVSRSSYGAAVTIFDPKDVTRNKFPMTMLLGCPHSVASCITWNTPTSNDYNGAEHWGGMFIAPGTRTLVAIEREASGPTCYGYATRDQSQHGKPHPGPERVVWCYSMLDALDQKAPMAYPYRLVAKLYDLADLVDVKRGRKEPWDLRQYATVDLPGSSPMEHVVSGAFNYVTGDYYLVRHVTGAPSTVHVYGGFDSQAVKRSAKVDGH